MNVGTKAWIAFGIVCIVTVAAVLVLMLVLVPQQNVAGVQTGEYEQIAKQEYTFSGEEIDKLKQQYSVTESDVNKGKKQNKFDDGNINPFTPKNEVTIYNEPTLGNDDKVNNGQLTPDMK